MQQEQLKRRARLLVNKDKIAFLISCPFIFSRISFRILFYNITNMLIKVKSLQLKSYSKITFTIYEYLTIYLSYK
ncbi:hypothetical protein V1477_014621 [Vespula maculifrons]|uniref:Uncharacterized protein n=1 Tax=Vespula maculifrons TaxID=7453 RepID=A0ABD2BHZ4_VESMC